VATLKNTTLSDTGFLRLPVGTTGQRPSPAAGQFRYNTTTGAVEIYTAGANIWQPAAARGVRADGGTVYDVDVEGTTYRVHVFTNTGNSTFTVTRSGTVEYLIVAGGGGGGVCWGGGGGAGGLLTGITTVTPQNYTITVEVGGTNRVNVSGDGGNGSNSSAFGLTAIGGGFGGGNCANPGGSGGSGGGGSNNAAGGTGTVGQGNNGATATSSGGGGGGAGASGAGNIGGIGISTFITGKSVFYAGGGTGGQGSLLAGGLGGGGIGGIALAIGVANATPNSGGGGGGSVISGTTGTSGIGGSGIVVIRYPLQSEPDVAAPKVASDGLVLDLDFAKPTVYRGSGTVVTDSRLNGVSGTLAGGTGRVNLRTHRAGLFFDGSDDRLDTSLRRAFNDVLTVECWYRGTKTSRNHLWNFLGENLHCNFNDGPFPLWMYWNSNGGNRVRYNGSFTDGTVKHLVFTHSGSTNKVFLNGVELPIADSGGTQTFSNIGAGGFNVGDNPFGGDIYVLKVYEKALSAAEVANNYNATRWRFGV